MTEKALSKKRGEELRALLEGQEFAAKLANVLPPGMTVQRFAQIVWIACTKNPRLQLTSPASFFRCVLELAAIGLEPDSRRAHLIPRRTKEGGYDCTYIIDYKGVKELLYREGDLASEHSDVVRVADSFDYEYGTHQHLTHKPFRGPRGEVSFAYCHVRLPSGRELFEVMSVEELEAVRRRSPAANEGPWVTDTPEMYKKTVFKRLAKGLPLSRRTREAIEKEDEFNELVSPTQTPGHPYGRQIASLEGEIDLGEVAQMPPERTEMPAERVSGPKRSTDEALGLSVLKRRLETSGFSEGELLALLVKLELAGPNDRFEDLSERNVKRVVGDWDKCVARLEHERQISSPPAHESEQPTDTSESPL